MSRPAQPGGRRLACRQLGLFSLSLKKHARKRGNFKVLSEALRDWPLEQLAGRSFATTAE